MTSILYRQPEIREASSIYEEGAKYFPDNYPYSLWTRERVLNLINQPNIAFVAEADGKIVGFIAGYSVYDGIPTDHGFIEWCFVNSDYRRQGICTELFRKMESQYIQGGKEYVVIDTTPDNMAIQNLILKTIN